MAVSCKVFFLTERSKTSKYVSLTEHRNRWVVKSAQIGMAKYKQCFCFGLSRQYITEECCASVPEAGTKCRDKFLHPIDIVGCNYLSLPQIPVSGTTLLLCRIRYRSELYVIYVPLSNIVPEAGIKGRTSNYIPHILWDVITCPVLDTCFWHNTPHMSNKISITDPCNIIYAPSVPHNSTVTVIYCI